MTDSTPKNLFIGSSTISQWPDLPVIDQKEPLSHGVYNAKIPEIFASIPPQFAQSNIDQIFFYGGGNDLFSGESADKAIKRLEKAIDEALSALSYQELTLLTLLPHPRFYKQKETIETYNQGLTELANNKDDIHVIDIYPHFIKDDHPIEAFFSEDKIHLNEQGYALLETLILKENRE